MKTTQKRCAVCGEVDVWLWAALVFKTREAIVLEDVGLLSFQVASGP